MSVLICIQTVLHSDSVPERAFLKMSILKKGQQTTTRHEKLPSMQIVKISFQPGTVVGIDSEWKPGFCGQIQK